MKNKINLQDSILNMVRKREIPVVIYLMNGFQLKGKVEGFDNFTIILKNNEKEQLIYKHAISTIEPVEEISGLLNNNKGDK
ncbi:MAG: RNA chaperone Hfq [Bacillota bacterium]